MFWVNFKIGDSCFGLWGIIVFVNCLSGVVSWEFVGEGDGRQIIAKRKSRGIPLNSGTAHGFFILSL
jgi:hypothetical protein